MKLDARKVKLLKQCDDMHLITLQFKSNSGEVCIATYERIVWQQAPEQVVNEMFHARVANGPLTVLHPAETAGKTERPRSAKKPRV